jgi:general secretion pathway protein C
LGELHFLGEVAKEIPTKQLAREVPEEVPETRLQLTLKGTYHSGDADRAVAIIAGPDGREEIYNVGDAMPGNVVLEEIGQLRVVLSRNGRLEALTFPRESAVGAASSVPSSRSTQPARRINAAPLVGRYISEAADNPEALLDIAQVEPVIEDGTFQGFRLRPGRKRSMLRRLGLRSGDVVTSINGTVLDNLPRAMELLQGLADATVIDATVLRNGEEIPYTFALN